MPLIQLSKDSSERGALIAFLAFCVWGALPIYWKALSDVPALQIMCHRVVWSLAFLTLALFFTGRLGYSLRVFKNRKTILILACSGFFLACNWLLFVWAIVSGKVVETSLGYYISPLLTILCGIFFFKDHAGKLVWTAIVLAAAGVLFQIIKVGHIPIVGLSIAGTFATYGMLRKIVGVEALPGLFVETALCAPFALTYLIWLALRSKGAFGHMGLEIDALLAISGVATTLPLLGFTYGARRVRLTTLGLLQYISPSATFLLGVFLYKEPLTKESLVTFACIWVALAIYSFDSWREHHKSSKVG